MEKYVEQLVADLQAAHKPKGVTVYPEFEYNPELTTTMVQLTGIAHNVFPPVKQLSKPQLDRLSEELKALIESYNYIINLPQRLPSSMVYEKLLSRWSVEIPYIYSGFSAEGWMFCEDEPDPCSMHEWCDSLMCEVDPATLPFYNGIYDDEGNKIDLLSIPTPDLCLSCAKFLIDDWDENLLCDMNRADEREEGEEFMCYAWLPRKDC